MHSIKEVTNAIEDSWSPYTAFTAGSWSKSNPARGQCVVSSFIIQDIFGGDLQKMKVDFGGSIESHYRNILPNGKILDVTRSQYPENQIMEPAEITLDGFQDIRQKLFSKANTEKRYKLLRATVLQKLS